MAVRWATEKQRFARSRHPLCQEWCQSDLHVADWTPVTGACDLPREPCVTGVTL